MDDFKNLILRSYKFTNVSIHKNYIKIENSSNLANSKYSFKDIKNTISKYGNLLYNCIGENPFDNKLLDLNSIKIKEVFVSFYKELGYEPSGSHCLCLKDKSLFFIDFDYLKHLAQMLIKFYFIFLLYDQSIAPFNETKLKKCLTYTKFLGYETVNINTFYNDIIELIFKEFNNHTIKFKLSFSKDANNIITTNITSSDIFSLALYAFKEQISTNSINTTNIGYCHRCNKSFIKNSNRQKYCMSCKKKVSYSKELDNRKIELLNKINALSDKLDYSNVYIRNNFSKFNSLLTNSRARLETRKKDIEDFYKKFKKSLTTN